MLHKKRLATRTSVNSVVDNLQLGTHLSDVDKQDKNEIDPEAQVKVLKEDESLIHMPEEQMSPKHARVEMVVKNKSPQVKGFRTSMPSQNIKKMRLSIKKPPQIPTLDLTSAELSDSINADLQPQK